MPAGVRPLHLTWKLMKIKADLTRNNLVATNGIQICFFRYSDNPLSYLWDIPFNLLIIQYLFSKKVKILAQKTPNKYDYPIAHNSLSN